jgi:hypothetical protein
VNVAHEGRRALGDLERDGNFIVLSLGDCGIDRGLPESADPVEHADPEHIAPELCSVEVALVPDAARVAERTERVQQKAFAVRRGCRDALQELVTVHGPDAAQRQGSDFRPLALIVLLRALCCNCATRAQQRRDHPEGGSEWANTHRTGPQAKAGPKAGNRLLVAGIGYSM